MDPLAAKYPSLNPYNYVENNPIVLIDPDGRGSDFNSFVSKEKINEAAKHNSKILTNEAETKMLNAVGPTVLDGMSLCFLLSGPAGAPFAVGTSTLSVYWNARLGDHDTDAAVSATTDLFGTLAKNPETAIALAAIQLLYDVTLSGKDPDGTKTDMFAPDNTRVDNSVQKSLLGLTGSKSPKEMWDEVHKDSDDDNSSNEDKDKTE